MPRSPFIRASTRNTGSIHGPKRFFYYNLFESDATGAPLAVFARGTGSIDGYAAAVGRWLVTRDGFDVLVSDIGLPDGSGLDLVRLLSRDHPVRAIALSGYGTRDDIRRSRDAGFQCHLTKPIDPEELVEVIEQVAADAIPSLAGNA